MLRGTADELATRHGKPAAIQFALIEAFLIHARALIHTFYPGGRVDRDDVLAADFFDVPASWEQARPALPAILAPIRERINGELAHISYRRLTVRDPSWDYVGILAAIEELFRVFHRAVPRKRLSADWPP